MMPPKTNKVIILDTIKNNEDKNNTKYCERIITFLEYGLVNIRRKELSSNCVPNNLIEFIKAKIKRKMLYKIII
ncbi:hypothetical protein [Spiroplasma endosymbiont of Lariophagus distinguendus]|uniref:hypothetical protein n=1 Tax=Spiroplasma endosymbiont of Lariophagus distinguendus TaxID=2935082 RepID=UPI0020794AB1|nr:hypothetical protein [Spiroplasma endosymbiont of Lariophagus distinguendus]